MGRRADGGFFHLEWARQDLNLRPFDYESTALTNWATGPTSDNVPAQNVVRSRFPRQVLRPYFSFLTR